MAVQILDAHKIRATIAALEERIELRFPGSGLQSVCNQVKEIAKRTEQRSREINQPIWWIRVIGWSLITLLFLLALVMPFVLASGFRNHELTLRTIMELGDPVLNEVVIVGALIYFLVSLETRVKRHRALKAIHELRSIAHVIDMHQLTKDPDRVSGGKYEATRMSPKATLTSFQLRRYLDYCSELLSLTGKLAAMYVQGFDDSVAITAANDVESMSTGLSQKIWQKIMILHDDHRESLRLERMAILDRESAVGDNKEAEM